MRSGETLVLRPTVEDLANPAVMASFAALRARLRGGAEAADRGSQLPEMLGRLNFDAAKWSDLLVVSPDGRPVAIGEEPPPVLPEASPRFAPDEVQAALARLENMPEPEPETEIEAEPIFEPVAAAAMAEDRFAPGSELRDVFMAERLVRAQTLKRAALERAANEIEAEPETNKDWLPVPAAEGVRLRGSLLTAWAIRTDTHASDRVLAPVAAAQPQRAAETTGRPERRGEGISQAFLTMQLRHALERLHAPARDVNKRDDKRSERR
jgi:hypothetical protein